MTTGVVINFVIGAVVANGAIGLTGTIIVNGLPLSPFAPLSQLLNQSAPLDCQMNALDGSMVIVN